MKLLPASSKRLADGVVGAKHACVSPAVALKPTRHSHALPAIIDIRLREKGESELLEVWRGVVHVNLVLCVKRPAAETARLALRSRPDVGNLVLDRAAHRPTQHLVRRGHTPRHASANGHDPLLAVWLDRNENIEIPASRAGVWRDSELEAGQLACWP